MTSARPLTPASSATDSPPLDAVGQATAAIRGLPEGRRRIVSALKRQGELDAEAIAQSVTMTPSGVRQHMAALTREDLVTFRTESAGPGRPRYLYRLTDAGDALFPRRYADLTNELLGYLADEDPEMLRHIFERRAERRLADARERTDGLSLDDRVTEIARILDDDGYLADSVRQDDGTFLIREHNCAVLNVALRFGHACGTELQFLQALLPDATVQRISHRVAGHHACAYLIVPIA